MTKVRMKPLLHKQENIYRMILSTFFGDLEELLLDRQCLFKL